MLSILIPVYNFPISPLVQDLLGQARELDVEVEIICLDDGSAPLYREQHRILADWPGVRYEELPENLGRSRIRNRLAEMASYPFLLFMDCDSAVAGPGFLSEYLQQAREQRVVVGKRIYHPEPPSDRRKYLRWLYGVERESKPADRRNEQPYHAFCTHHFLVPKAVFSQIQFDPALRQYGHEDTQFGLDLRRIGVEVLHTDTPLLHIDLEDAETFLEKTRKGIQNLVYLQQKGSGIETRLTHLYGRLKKIGLSPLLSTIYLTSHQVLERQLTGPKPSLRIFDWYKLCYLAYCQRRGSTEQP